MIMSMFEGFLDTLVHQCFVKKSDSVLVCCSGGIDSMVLLNLMMRASSRIGLRIGVVHVDHGIRGDASHRDALFVAGQCKEMGVECYTYELNMDHDTANIEEEARLKRYDAIMRCMDDHGFRYAATGHTMDDQAETLIYRFIRGSGIKGMAGMDTVSNDKLIRPLLGVSRVQIESYAAENGISHVEDFTNDDTRLVRNMIRHEILPLMKKINPSVVESVSRFSGIAREEGQVLSNMAVTLETDACLVDWDMVRVYSAQNILDAPTAVTKRFIISVLSDMLREPRGVDAIQVQAVLDVIRDRSRAHTVKRKVRVELSGRELVFARTGKGPFYDMQIPSPGMYLLEAIGQRLKIDFPAEVCTPLRVRSLMQGDRLQNKRAVKILAGAGVSRPLRPFWPVVLFRDEVVCIAGIAGQERERGIETEFPCHG